MCIKLDEIFKETCSYSPNQLHRSRYRKNFERKNVDIFLTISRNVCFGCSKEPSHRDGSFEYPQHMFPLRNKKINF